MCAQGAILEDARVKQRCSRCDFELKRDDRLILDETGGMSQSQPHTAPGRQQYGGIWVCN